MSTIPEALSDINSAFNHLEFAIRLMCNIELGNINLEQMDSDIALLFDQETINYPSGKFNNDGFAIESSQALVGMAFGTTALVLDAAFEIAGIKKNIESIEPNHEIRRLVYMVRCAFAHNPAMPLWHAKGKDFSRSIKIETPEISLFVDLARLNNTPFEYHHIGGLGMWKKIRAASELVILQNQLNFSNQPQHHETNI